MLFVNNAATRDAMRRALAHLSLPHTDSSVYDLSVEPRGLALIEVADDAEEFFSESNFSHVLFGIDGAA